MVNSLYSHIDYENLPSDSIFRQKTDNNALGTDKQMAKNAI